MNNNPNENIRFANAEVMITQGRYEDNENVYHVVASLIFNDAVIECDYGEIHLGIKKAVFTLKVNNGNMPQAEHCYLNYSSGYIKEVNTERTSNSTNTEGGILGRVGVDKNASADSSASFGAGAGGAALRERRSERTSFREDEQIYKRYSVRSRGNNPDTGTSKWSIFSEIQNKPIIGDVFADSDDGGRLGILRTKTPQECSIEPTLEIRHRAIIPVPGESHFVTHKKQKKFEKKFERSEKLSDIIIREDLNDTYMIFNSAKPGGVENNE